MKISRILLSVVFLGLFATSAHAGVFIGGGINNNSFGYDNVDNSTGNQLYAGYYFDSGVFLEVSRVDLGEGDVENTSYALDMSGMAYYVGYKSELPSGFGWYAKGGLYSIDTKVDGLGEESSSGLTLGGGILYAFNKHFALRAGLHMFVGVEDFDQDESVVGGSLSVEARF